MKGNMIQRATEMMNNQYYNNNYLKYFNRTIALNLKPQYRMFLKYIPDGGRILDAGCGVGRDSYHFLERKYHVISIDASPRMVELTTLVTERLAITCPFRNLNFIAEFDGIWASASLLHLTETELHDVFPLFIRALKPGGCWYMSFKVGLGCEVTNNDRFFSYQTQESLFNIIKQYPSIKILESSYSKTVEDLWIQVIVKKKSNVAIDLKE